MGFCRKILKIICSAATPSCCTQHPPPPSIPHSRRNCEFSLPASVRAGARTPRLASAPRTAHSAIASGRVRRLRASAAIRPYAVGSQPAKSFPASQAEKIVPASSRQNWARVSFEKPPMNFPPGPCRKHPPCRTASCRLRTAARNVAIAVSSVTSPHPAPSCHVPSPTSPTRRPVRSEDPRLHRAEDGSAMKGMRATCDVADDPARNPFCRSTACAASDYAGRLDLNQPNKSRGQARGLNVNSYLRMISLRARRHHRHSASTAMLRSMSVCNSASAVRPAS